jgi:hypothetical protein
MYMRAFECPPADAFTGSPTAPAMVAATSGEV